MIPTLGISKRKKTSLVYWEVGGKIKACWGYFLYLELCSELLKVKGCDRNSSGFDFMFHN